MKVKKIFVIGFNKTATSTFHMLFLKNGLTSQHDGSRWDLDDYQCFSDNGNLRAWKNYYRDYRSSVFVLNTRPLESWIVSRAKHCYAERLSWGYPPKMDLYRSWILERHAHYAEVIRFFKKKPGRLIIVDISESDWLAYVCDRLRLEYFDLNVNKAKSHIPDSHMSEVREVMGQAMDDLSIAGSDRGSSLLIPSLMTEKDWKECSSLSSRYENNFGYGSRKVSEILLELRTRLEQTKGATIEASLRVAEIKAAKLEERDRAAEVTVRALDERAKKAEKELVRIYQSRSWRITSPLRNASKLIRND